MQERRETVLAKTCCRWHPGWAIRRLPRIFECQAVQGLDLVGIGLGRLPRAVQRACLVGRPVEQIVVEPVFGSS